MKKCSQRLLEKAMPKNLRPEPVSGDHRVGLFRLGRFEGPEGVGVLTILEQRVLHGGPVNRTEQGTTQNTGYTHHVEGVQRPVVEALEKQQEPEDGRHAEAGGQRTSWTAPGGYIRKTLTNTAMGAEKAMALYGRRPTSRATSN